MAKAWVDREKKGYSVTGNVLGSYYKEFYVEEGSGMGDKR